MNIIFQGSYTGLYGTFTFANKDYKLEIKKVYTQVTNGRFQVDMEFVGEVPREFVVDRHYRYALLSVMK